MSIHIRKKIQNDVEFVRRQIFKYLFTEVRDEAVRLVCGLRITIWIAVTRLNTPKNIRTWYFLDLYCTYYFLRLVTRIFGAVSVLFSFNFIF